MKVSDLKDGEQEVWALYQYLVAENDEDFAKDEDFIQDQMKKEDASIQNYLTNLMTHVKKERAGAGK